MSETTEIEVANANGDAGLLPEHENEPEDPTEEPDEPGPNDDALDAAWAAEDELVPQDGDVLEPGEHLIELETVRILPREVLTEGMRRIGFGEVLIDQSEPPQGRSALVRHHRLVGRLDRAVTIANRDDTRWTYARHLKTPNVTTPPTRLKIEAFDLHPGRVYEARFISRMRSQPTRDMVDHDLREMGWEVLKLAALRRDVRDPKRPNVSKTVWFGILFWDSPESLITEDEPFVFEDVTAL